MDEQSYLERYYQREREYLEAIKFNLPRVAAARIRYMAKLDAEYYHVTYEQAMHDLTVKYNCDTKYIRL